MNQFVHGDCLEVLKTLPSASVDLAYLDPPFYSNAQYEKIWNDRGETASFNDRWKGGIETYIEWLYDRVVEIYRTLAPNGSIFLHCDWHASHRIRLQILDKIFGRNNFRNEIIWCYKKWSGGRNQLTRNHDTIFWYSMSEDDCIYNQLYEERAESTKKRFGSKRIISGEVDEHGKRIPSVTAEDDSVGVRLSDWWEIPIIAPSAHERIGYMTQKPEALVERIILMASNKGDIVLDPFMGGGTTPFAADKLGRQWLGIDASAAAVRISEMRMNKRKDLLSAPFMVMLHQYDKETLKKMPPHAFADFICQHLGGKSNPKKQGDRGIDGWDTTNNPIQVKQSEGVSRQVVALFATDAKSNNIAHYEKNIAAGRTVGCIIAFSFSKGAYEEASALKNQQGILIELKRVDEVIGIAGVPPITLSCTWEDVDGRPDQKCIHFTAAAQEVEGRNIVNYAYDFNYDEESGFDVNEYISKDGLATVVLETGLHVVAVKATDDGGVENVVFRRLTVNGVVTMLL